MKKFLANVMTLAMLAGLACSATACGDIGATVIVDIDETKTQIYVASYSGGVGWDWLDETKKRFEEKYAETSFEDGKTGVQVIIDHSKAYTENGMMGMGTSDNEIYFGGASSYYDMVAANLLEDITDVVTQVNPNDNKTIESKLSETRKTGMNMDGKYYALPYAEYYQGISYDADLFKKNKLYFSDELDENDEVYPGTNAFVSTPNATNLSCGPDGVFDTYDDGLPSTYQEFYKLLDRMVDGRGGEKIEPFAFPGASTHYTNMVMESLAANYVGADGWRTNYNYNSNGEEVEIVTGWSGSTPQTTKMVLTKDNAYKIKSSLGMYYASEFCHKIFVDTKYYAKDCASGTMSNLATQERFLKSGLDGGTPIGMLIEGSYWFCEAEEEGVLDRAKKLSDDGSVKDVRFMPLPHQYAGTVTPRDASEAMTPVLVSSNCWAAINKNTPSNHMKAAKAFLSFCYSDAELEYATIDSEGIMKGVNFDISGIKDDLSPYAKNLVEMRDAAVQNDTLVVQMSKDPIFVYNSTYFVTSSSSEYWTSALDADFQVVFRAFSTTQCSAKDYFLGLEMKENTWKNKYNKNYD